MAYLFGVLDFLADGRLTGVWNYTRADPPAGEEVGSGHFVWLPSEQHADVESDFLSSHMPLHVGGLSGVDAEGDPWLFILQKCPVNSGLRLPSSDDPFQPLQQALGRALQFNPDATVGLELLWTHTDLVDVYASRMVPPQQVQTWTVADLQRGLLAECCNIDLSEIVRRYPGCAFPHEEHDCAGDVFTDVFSAWSELRIPQPNPQEDE